MHKKTQEWLDNLKLPETRCPKCGAKVIDGEVYDRDSNSFHSGVKVLLDVQYEEGYIIFESTEGAVAFHECPMYKEHMCRFY